MFLAGPESGAVSKPTFRRIVLADLPGGIGGTWGEILGTLDNQTDLQAALGAKQDKLVVFDSKTDSHTLVLTDTAVSISKATAVNLTVPLNSSVPFEIGTVIYLKRTGVGVMTVVATGGVTITGSSGSLTDPGLNVIMTIIKTGTNTWDLQNGSPGAYINWTPTFTGFSANPTITESRYTVIGKTCIWYFKGTAGTSNATTYTMTAPFTAKAVQFAPGPITDNSVGSVNAGVARTLAGSNIVTITKDLIGNGWTASGTKLWQGTLIFEIE